MAGTPITALLHHLRCLRNAAVERSDSDLLRRYVVNHDEEAFAALLRRHAPLVWGVCRRLLVNEQDAEDAFQAVFLVLLRKAESLRVGPSLASWLHAVATRIAQKSRVATLRRHLREKRAETPRPSDPFAAVEQREMRALLDEELDRLPEKYRAPLVLCYLEGLSYTEAARQLGWRGGTVCGRLARARAMLRTRLSRRGVTLSVAALAALAEPVAAPAATVTAVAKLAALFALGQTAGSGTVSASAALLAQGAMHAMNVAKLKMMAALIVVLGLFAAGAGVTASHFLARQSPQIETAAGAPDKPATEKTERTDLYGDPLPPRALARMGTLRFRHDNLIGNVAYSRDGKRLAAAGQGGIIRLYDPATGRTLGQFRAQDPLYPSIAFAPDGKTLASLGTNLIQFWDVHSSKELRRFDIGAKANDNYFSSVPFVFSPDGRLLASVGADHFVRIWEAKNGKELVKLPGHQTPIACLAFSPDGKTLLSASDRSGDQAGSVLIWNAATGEEVRKISFHRPGKEPTPLCFSPDGKTLAFAAWQRLERKHAKGTTVMQAHAVALLDLETGKEIRKMGPLIGRLKAASFSPDGKVITAMNDEQQSGPGRSKNEVGRIQGWETATGKRLFDFPAPASSSDFWGGAGTLLAFAPDGKTLAAASGSSLHLWDLTRGRENLEKPETHQSKVMRVAFSPDGRTVATGSSDQTLALWDAATGKQRLLLRGHEGEVWDVAFSPDGKLLASASHHMEQAVRLWDVAAGKEIRRFEVPSPPTGDGGSFWSVVTWISFTENGKTLAACGNDGTIRLWDVTTGKELFNERVRGLPAQPKGHKAAMYFTHDPVFTLDGRMVAFSSAKTLYIVDVAAGQPLFQFEKGTFGRTVLALSADGKTLLYRANKSVQLMEIASGKDLHKLDLPADEVNAAFSPDGRTIAVSRDAQATIRLFDVPSGKELLRLRGHEAAVSSLAFSPDGTKLASGQWDSTALVWDISAVRRKLPRRDLTDNDLDRLWTDLRDADAVKAHAALWTLAAAPDEAVRFLKQHLHPVPRIAADRLQRLIADLDADQFARREEASRQLAKLGSEAEPALRKVLENKPSLETRRRVDALLKDLACQTAMTPDALRQLRAIQVLEQIGSAEARNILKSLAQGAPAAPATRDAAAVLQRLQRRSSAP